jgi:hypothetical protein
MDQLCYKPLAITNIVLKQDVLLKLRGALFIRTVSLPKGIV